MGRITNLTEFLKMFLAPAQSLIMYNPTRYYNYKKCENIKINKIFLETRHFDIDCLIQY